MSMMIKLKGINMIVKDKKASIEKAHDIAKKMTKLFTDEVCSFNDDGDPAEQIYLAAHTLAAVNMNFCIAMDGIGKIFGINNFDSKVFEKFVNEIVKELSSCNESSSDDIVEKFKEQNFN